MDNLFRRNYSYVIIKKFIFVLMFIGSYNSTFTFRTVKIAFAFLFFTHILFAQKPVVNGYEAVDKKILGIADSLTGTTDDLAGFITSNFSSDKDKVRAIFTWITHNIQYDFENMFAINLYENRSDKILKVLKSRKGICENYAALFNELCAKARLRAYMIEGYTKQNGFTDYIPHAWNAALVDSSWVLFDPTWGSGYVSNGKFVKKTDYNYFLVKPSRLIKSHMPFDYLWQFLLYPVTNQEFYEGKIQENKTKPFFSFPDSLNAFDQQSKMEQLKASGERIERNGVKNAMIFDRLQFIKREVEHDRQTRSVNLYNSAVGDYNIAVNFFNDFINYRNKQFKPLKSDAEIQTMLDDANNKLKSAKEKVGAIKEPDANTITLIQQIGNSFLDLESRITEQQTWLSQYFSKGKSARKTMFYERKITWFGVPLN